MCKKMIYINQQFFQKTYVTFKECCHKKFSKNTTRVETLSCFDEKCLNCNSRRKKFDIEFRNCDRLSTKDLVHNHTFQCFHINIQCIQKIWFIGKPIFRPVFCVKTSFHMKKFQAPSKCFKQKLICLKEIVILQKQCGFDTCSHFVLVSREDIFYIKHVFMYNLSSYISPDFEKISDETRFHIKVPGSHNI